MPKKLESCVKKVSKKYPGKKGRSKAYAICTSAMMKKKKKTRK